MTSLRTVPLPDLFAHQKWIEAAIDEAAKKNSRQKIDPGICPGLDTTGK